jgi:hypothetical protein
MGLAPRLLFTTSLIITRNQRITTAWDKRTSASKPEMSDPDAKITQGPNQTSVVIWFVTGRAARDASTDRGAARRPRYVTAWHGHCHSKTSCLTVGGMAATITIRTDDETEHALDVLTHDGSSRSAAIRQAVLEAASRRERAAEMRRAVLRMNLGQPDGVNVAAELTRDRADER